MSKKKTRLKFSLSLVAVIALMAAVIGVGKYTHGCQGNVFP